MSHELKKFVCESYDKPIVYQHIAQKDPMEAELISGCSKGETWLRSKGFNGHIFSDPKARCEWQPDKRRDQ